MTRSAFEASLARAIPRHAADSVRRGLWTEALSIEASRREFDELLPAGIDTPGHFFCAIVDAVDGTVVGETWYSIEAKGGKLQFWVDWIGIEPPHRRRGYATEVLRQLEEKAKVEGAERIGLGVAHDNDAARALYSKVGYVTWRSQMLKELKTGART